MSSGHEGLLGRLSGGTVLTVGDAMLDEYVWGHVRRISPEAPVPVVDVQGRTHVPGGAANVAAGIVALGGSALLGAVVGSDGQAEQLRQALEDRGVDCGGLLVDESRATTTKTRVIAQSQQVVRADSEETGPLRSDLEDALLTWAGHAVAGADAVVVSDYAKGVVSARVAEGVIGLAQQAGKPVVVDPKGRDYGKYRGATVLTPNVHDVERAANFSVERYEDLLEVGRRLAEVLPGSKLLITRGAEGMSLLSEGGITDVHAESRGVYDVTGAGDTVVATLAVALANDLPLEDAVRLANTAAGIAVSKVGTASVTLDELRALEPAATGLHAEGPPARRLDRPSP